MAGAAWPPSTARASCCATRYSTYDPSACACCAPTWPRWRRAPCACAGSGPTRRPRAAPPYTGVWLGERKICAIGERLGAGPGGARPMVVRAELRAGVTSAGFESSAHCLYLRLFSLISSEPGHFGGHVVPAHSYLEMERQREVSCPGCFTISGQ